MQDGLLDTRQAAELLGLRPSTLEQWRWQGRGPEHVRLSRRAVRYRREDLDAYIAENMAGSTAEADARTG